MSQPRGRHKEQAEGMIGSDLAVISFLLFKLASCRTCDLFKEITEWSGVEWSEGSIN
jgi:hypothetical protein